MAKSAFWLIGWVLLLCVVLLTGCGTSPAGNQSVVPAANSGTGSNTVAEATVVNSTEVNSVGDTLPVPELTAKIGKITFALEATPQRESINPGLLFTKGITQVHALFDYSGMSTAYTWERVWYLNDKEVSRKAGVWTGPESGVFDYFIDNGGRPLPAGDWVLEIYVEDKLLSLGAFVIENPEAEANTETLID
jgi:hypothetical protein